VPLPYSLQVALEIGTAVDDEQAAAQPESSGRRSHLYRLTRSLNFGQVAARRGRAFHDVHVGGDEAGDCLSWDPLDVDYVARDYTPRVSSRRRESASVARGKKKKKKRKKKKNKKNRGEKKKGEKKKTSS